MKKHYLVHITHNDPYPKEYHYRKTAIKISVAIKRAVDSFLKENGGRVIKELRIQATKL